MKIYTKIVIQMTDSVGEYLPLVEEFFYYEGPVEKACFGGASSTENQISQSQQQLYNTMSSNYSTQFAGQSAILKSLTDSAQPILNAGINQFGYSAPEEAALRTQSSEGTAAGYKMANQATKEGLAAVGGGNAYLPSGVKAGIQASNATKFAAEDANQQLGITESGYAQGRQNYLTATGLLTNTAQMENPTAYGSEALTGGQDAFGAAQTINDANQRGWQTIAGLAGGAASSFLGGFGSSLGKGKG